MSPNESFDIKNQFLLRILTEIKGKIWRYTLKQIFIYKYTHCKWIEIIFFSVIPNFLTMWCLLSLRFTEIFILLLFHELKFFLFMHFNPFLLECLENFSSALFISLSCILFFYYEFLSFHKNLIVISWKLIVIGTYCFAFVCNVYSSSKFTEIMILFKNRIDF